MRRVGFGLLTAPEESVAGQIQVTREVVFTPKTAPDGLSGKIEYDIRARADDQGVLTGRGTLTFEMKSSTSTWQATEEFAVEGHLRDSQLRIVGPKQVKYTCVQAPPPPPDPKIAAVYWKVGDSDVLAIRDDFSLFNLTLTLGQYGPDTRTLDDPDHRFTMTTRVATPMLMERLTIGGRVEVGDVFRVEIGEAAVSISAAEPNPTATAAQLAAAWTASESAQGTGVVAAASGADVWLTVNDPAHAFTCQIDTTEADGPSSDGQTFASSRRFIAGGLTAGYWKKEIRHCNRLLTTWYSEDPSPTVGFFQSFQCPVCGAYTQQGDWSLVVP